MGTKGREIIGKDLGKIIELLTKAFADEWLAYYQYWVGAKVVAGPMKDEVIAELLQHATDELNHANLVADRIVQLGADPILAPADWYKYTNCGYEAPTDKYVYEILKQNIKGEQCAIEVYEKIAKLTESSDFVTNQMVKQILTDEIEHEEDLQNLKEDLDLMMERMKIK